MSDQDTPPPMDDSNLGPDAPGPDFPKEHDPVIPAGAAPVSSVALGQGKLAESDEKTMSMLAHILGALTCVVGPLLIWVLKKEESPFVDDQGKEAINFQITILIGYVTVAILAALTCFGGILGPVVGIYSLIFAILGGIEANKGIAYRYPYTLRLIK